MNHEQERLAVLGVLQAAKLYGYSNMISHLKTAWARQRVLQGMTDDVAFAGANAEAYAFHHQDKLLQERDIAETTDNG